MCQFVKTNFKPFCEGDFSSLPLDNQWKDKRLLKKMTKKVWCWIRTQSMMKKMEQGMTICCGQQRQQTDHMTVTPSHTCGKTKFVSFSELKTSCVSDASGRDNESAVMTTKTSIKTQPAMKNSNEQKWVNHGVNSQTLMDEKQSNEFSIDREIIQREQDYSCCPHDLHRNEWNSSHWSKIVMGSLPAKHFFCNLNRVAHLPTLLHPPNNIMGTRTWGHELFHCWIIAELSLERDVELFNLQSPLKETLNSSISVDFSSKCTCPELEICGNSCISHQKQTN